MKVAPSIQRMTSAKVSAVRTFMRHAHEEPPRAHGERAVSHGVDHGSQNGMSLPQRERVRVRDRENPGEHRGDAHAPVGEEHEARRHHEGPVAPDAKVLRAPHVVQEQRAALVGIDGGVQPHGPRVAEVPGEEHEREGAGAHRRKRAIPVREAVADEQDEEQPEGEARAREAPEGQRRADARCRVGLCHAREASTRPLAGACSRPWRT